MVLDANGSEDAKSNRKSHFLMVILSLIVSGSFPVVAAITPGHDPTVLTFWRFLTATIIFGLMFPFVKGFRLPGFRDLGRYFAVGGSYGLFFIFMFASLKETTPINTGTIFTTLPLMTMLLGGVVGEPIRPRQLWILGLSMAATLWVIFRGDVHLMLGFSVSRGDWLFFLGTGSLAVYMVAMKKMQGDESRVCFTFFSLLTATMALLGAAVWRTGGWRFQARGCGWASRILPDHPRPLRSGYFNMPPPGWGPPGSAAIRF